MPRVAANPGTDRAAFASDIVLAGGWGFLSGVLPIDLADDGVPLPEGVERQTRKILANLEVLLQKAGLGKENIVSVRVSLVEFPRLYERMNEAYAGFFAADRLPARSCVGVSHLPGGRRSRWISCSARRRPEAGGPIASYGLALVGDSAAAWAAVVMNCASRS
jgi:2-iminobutanoate/2-iminopropanoate deaminase